MFRRSATLARHELKTSMKFRLNFIKTTILLVSQVLPEPVTPLTYSTLVRIVDVNMCRNVLRCDPSPFFPSISRVSHHRVAFEVCNMFMQAVEPTVTMENRMHGMIVFGHEFINERIHRIALERNGLATSRKKTPLLWDVAKVSCE